jgi:hypothetical protein
VKDSYFYCKLAFTSFQLPNYFKSIFFFLLLPDELISEDELKFIEINGIVHMSCEKLDYWIDQFLRFVNSI